MNEQLLVQIMNRNCGPGWERRKARELTADAIVEALWPLNELFQGKVASIQSQPYQADLEPQADRAIERYAEHGSWKAVSLEVRRILLERHTQAITWFTLEGKTAPWKTYMSVPDNLPAKTLPAAILLYLIHGMSLPFPVAES
ncbi:hypothetical protein [Pseudomonas knackmussii]|uniref:hypothetical protein n=1 Tax=Pseudomonas knackmussii TaxID=65741 RepID=UPI003F4A409E